MIIYINCGYSAGGLYKSDEYKERKELKYSLFGKNDELSEKNIRRILNSRIKLKKKMKLAVISFEHESPRITNYFGYDYQFNEKYLNLNAAYFNVIHNTLYKTGRFIEITIVPKILIPKEMTINSLRQLSVRMQADLFLIYKTYSNIFSERNIFSPNETKAYSAVEGALIHTPTGIIPFARTHSVIHNEYEKHIDKNIRELELRSEKIATIKALRLLANGMSNFFGWQEKEI